MMPSSLVESSLRILIVDNFDSYTFNLYQYCSRHGQVVVVRNDISREKFESIVKQFDAIVLSPGPGNPSRSEDFGVCTYILETQKNVSKDFAIPILGVCLGMQGIGTAFGGKVVRAPEPVHGRLSCIHRIGESVLYGGCPSSFNVVRYHSLMVEGNTRSFPSCLRVTASTNDLAGNPIIMSLEHESLPIFGVQYHPESICTNFGKKILENFCSFAAERRSRRCPVDSYDHLSESSFMSVLPNLDTDLEGPIQISAAKKLSIRWRKMAGVNLSADDVFVSLFGDQPNAFWLDSAKIQPTLGKSFSYMGDARGPSSCILKYWASSSILETTCMRPDGTLSISETQLSTPFLDHVERIMSSYTLPNSAEYPFHFSGGLVGFVGYEMCNETLPKRVHAHPDSSVPDAAFIFADRFIVFDHDSMECWAVELFPNHDEKYCSNAVYGSWLQEMESRFEQGFLSASNPHAVRIPEKMPKWHLREDRDAYLSNVCKSLELIKEGETYEVCLTTQISRTFMLDGKPDPLQLYHRLRSRNPAPYAAFLKLGEDLAVCGSSPELFMQITKGQVRMKPIKGTVSRILSGPDHEALDEARRAALEASEKDRAENLMIVDLIRNDLSQICDPSSIEVPVLMGTETYATVHQLVSTVEGRLRKGISPVHSLKYTFPPGSMTGAPKLRTVELLQKLEGGKRGIYSGVLGYFSLNGNSTFNVVIRTAVIENDGVSIGAGGAIVIQSDPEGEFDEMLLKANSVLPR